MQYENNTWLHDGIFETTNQKIIITTTINGVVTPYELGPTLQGSKISHLAKRLDGHLQKCLGRGDVSFQQVGLKKYSHQLESERPIVPGHAFCWYSFHPVLALFVQN